MWRERKRRSEAQTLTMMNGNKLRKDNGIESAHIVGILSRRMIREVPALKFFDVEPEPTTNSLPAAVGVGGRPPAVAVLSPTADRNTPRGVCYTLDANGCRCIKMESGALRASRTNSRDHRNRKSEEITIEKAMAKTLRRKFVQRTLLLSCLSPVVPAYRHSRVSLVRGHALQNGEAREDEAAGDPEARGRLPQVPHERVDEAPVAARCGSAVLAASTYELVAAVGD